VVSQVPVVAISTAPGLEREGSQHLIFVDAVVVGSGGWPTRSRFATRHCLKSRRPFARVVRLVWKVWKSISLHWTQPPHVRLNFRDGQVLIAHHFGSLLLTTSLPSTNKTKKQFERSTYHRLKLESTNAISTQDNKLPGSVGFPAKM
jgi:hypothetical protein